MCKQYLLLIFDNCLSENQPSLHFRFSQLEGSQNAFRKEYKAETISNDEEMFDLQTMLILTYNDAPYKFYELLKRKK